MKNIFFLCQLLLLLFMTVPGNSQVEIDLPVEITVYLDGERFEPGPGWTDSLVQEAQMNRLLYRLTRANKNADLSVQSSIKIPQFLTIPEVIRQVILYYALLSNEGDRVRERVYVFPYFADFDSTPNITCRYESNGIYHINVAYWQTVDTPVPPKPEERHIYNQVMTISFSSVQQFSSVPREIFAEVAFNNRIEVDDVIRIYQNVYLWNLSR